MMTTWQFYGLMLSAFVLGFATRTLLMWAVILWRMRRDLHCTKRVVH
jgi:hypothetical protein